MDTSVPEHDTLGNKHKQYNELLGKVIKGETAIQLENVNFDKNDQHNLLMIDIASEKRDVEYILTIFKSDDMLYVSRALRKCTWLFTNNQYSHIINPQYLNDHLLPMMTTKAGIQLLKNIRRHLTDEPRVEQFFLHEKRTKEALKWLPNCSLPFIEEKVKTFSNSLEPKIFKRLCEKSETVFEIVAGNNCSILTSKYAIFLLTTHTEQYLNILENTSYMGLLKFNAKSTALLMKKVPDRVTERFEKYVAFIDIPTFAKYIKKEYIQDFLLEQANKDHNDYYIRNFLNSPEIAYLIERISREERFDFVKKVFIDNIATDNDTEVIPLDSLRYRMEKLSQAVRLEKHKWYKFAPFDIAFKEITNMIKVETDHNEKYSMLSTLVSCVGKNEKNLQTLLQYYAKNHINDDYQLKNQFVNDLIQQTQIFKYDQKSWKILNEIFKIMDLYVDNDEDPQHCIVSVILHNILNNEDVPEVIIKKFSFDTLVYHRKKLHSTEQEKVFIFLYNHLLTKIQGTNHVITTETELVEMREMLEKVMNLLKDWEKELLDYPFVLQKIKDIAKIKQENLWDTSLSELYNLKKSWRKHLFEESITLNPSEEVCVNALKHDPALLFRYNKKVKEMCYNDKISMKRLHSKLRIYWPKSLAIDWTNAYRERLNILGGHKALIRGLCGLVPEKSLIEIIKNYAPKEAKINWKEIDEQTLSLQRHIAKNMHFARPQIDPSAILLYAKGDYLQYALPSLTAVFYNMKLSLSREFIPKLLDAPVSVQKHGIRFVFLKLELKELKTIFSHIWNSSKNISIRAELFKHTFKLLCNSEESEKVAEVWSLLELFLDNLTHKDESKIFDHLVSIGQVPAIIRPEYLIKSYNVFKRLLHHFSGDRLCSYKRYMLTLVTYSRELMEFIDNEFIVQIILEYINKELFNFDGKAAEAITIQNSMVKVMSAYLLYSEDVEEQTQRYETILAPVIKRLIDFEKNNTSMESNNLHNLAALLFRLFMDLKEYVLDNNVIIPYKMFCYIQEELESLPVPKNYCMITMWKLTTILTKLLSENDTTCTWDEITTEIAPDFAIICRSYLKEEVIVRFPCIYVIFSEVLKKLIREIPIEGKCKFYEIMLEDKNFVEAFLAVIIMLPASSYCNEYDKQKYTKIYETILEHTLPEIKMHYYSKFQTYVTCMEIC